MILGDMDGSARSLKNLISSRLEAVRCCFLSSFTCAVVAEVLDSFFPRGRNVVIRHDCTTRLSIIVIYD
jgi:hypothetical protein